MVLYVCAVQAENMVSLKIASDEHVKEEAELVKENNALKQEIVEINLRHIEEINNIRLVLYYVNNYYRTDAMSVTATTRRRGLCLTAVVVLLFRNTPESCGS